jgi:hypothetical protein
MRVKREYLTNELPKPEIRTIERVVERLVPQVVEKAFTDPIVIKRLAQIEKLVREIIENEAADEGPEEPDPEILEILARLDSLAAKVEQAAKAPALPPPQPKQPYQFDVVRNAAGDIERIVARPLAGSTIYAGVK